MKGHAKFFMTRRWLDSNFKFKNERNVKKFVKTEFKLVTRNKNKIEERCTIFPVCHVVQYKRPNWQLTANTFIASPIYHPHNIIVIRVFWDVNDRSWSALMEKLMKKIWKIPVRNRGLGIWNIKNVYKSQDSSAKVQMFLGETGNISYTNHRKHRRNFNASYSHVSSVDKSQLIW